MSPVRGAGTAMHTTDLSGIDIGTTDRCIAAAQAIDRKDPSAA